MSEELYSPPASDVAAGTASEEGRHYVVGIRKFLVLSIATLNLYSVYWFWRNWRNVKEATGEDLWPVPRAIFSVFFTHALLSDVDDHIRDQGRTYAWSASGTATLIVILTVVSSVAGNATDQIEDVDPFVDLFFLVLGLLVPLATIPAQRAINEANGDAEGETNARLTLANWLWMLPGLGFWVLILLGFGVLFSERV